MAISKKKLPKLYIEIKKDFANWGWIGMPMSTTRCKRLQINKKKVKETRFDLRNAILYTLVYFFQMINLIAKEQNIVGASVKTTYFKALLQRFNFSDEFSKEPFSKIHFENTCIIKDMLLIPCKRYYF